MWNRQRNGRNKAFSWNYYPKNKSSKFDEGNRIKKKETVTGEQNCKCLWGYIIKFRILFSVFFFQCVRCVIFFCSLSLLLLLLANTHRLLCALLIALVIRCFAHQTSGNARKTFNLSQFFFSCGAVISSTHVRTATCNVHIFFPTKIITNSLYISFFFFIRTTAVVVWNHDDGRRVYVYIWKGFALATLIFLPFFIHSLTVTTKAVVTVEKKQNKTKCN